MQRTASGSDHRNDSASDPDQTRKSKNSPVVDYAVYLLVRVLVCIVQALSWQLARKLAEGLAWLTYRIDRRHRRVALENLEHAFPEMDPAARDELVRACYRHFTLMAMEMVRLPRTLHRSNRDDYVLYANPGDLERVMGWINSGRPLMVVTGHFGNWELLNYITGLIGCTGGIIARRLDNPYLDRLIIGWRAKTGLVVLDKSADYARILQIFQSGGNLGMVGDQDAGRRGLFVRFLGRPASTFKSIALLSLEYQVPILVEGAARVGHPLQYRLYLEDVILPEEYADQRDAVRLITQRYTDALERMVRRHPEQYFWLHRRWKHQPPAKKARLAA